MEMGQQQQQHEQDSPLNKRRRFAPDSLPIIASEDNEAIVNHTFDSPLLLQLCEQAPTPHEIEAQLLQVGMRIRRAVSEGYQRRAFTPRPFFNASRLSAETIQAICGGPGEDGYSAGGLHTVGTLAMQPISTATFCGINLAALSHISSAPMLEEQRLWSYSTSSKRNLEEDSDSDNGSDFMPHTPQLLYADAGLHYGQDYFSIDVDSVSDAGTFAQVGMVNKQTGRRMAVPKSRLSRPVSDDTVTTGNAFAHVSAATCGVIQPQPPSCHIETAMDFGEASFLQPRQDVEMDCS